jgi:7-cyano-7-deazaguanine reductase
LVVLDSLRQQVITGLAAGHLVRLFTGVILAGVRQLARGRLGREIGPSIARVLTWQRRYGEVCGPTENLLSTSVPVDPPATLLGKPSTYPTTYTPSLLSSIGRAQQRESLGLDEPPRFSGEDVWTGFELSWLNNNGKPHVAGVRIKVSCSSPCIVESKSLKLYLNSYAQTQFTNATEVLSTLNSDFAIAFRAPVLVELIDLARLGTPADKFPGTCLDDLDVVVQEYERNPELLELEDGVERIVNETVYSDLFRSLCPVTGQPDWASIMVQYRGRPIGRESLLLYLISYRNHRAFHETTIEQIFGDIAEACSTEQLTVYGRFLRRGGVEICPFRSDSEDIAPLIRLPRQ